MTIEINIKFDPCTETIEQALAALAKKTAPSAPNVSQPPVESAEPAEPVASAEPVEPKPQKPETEITKTDIRAIATAISKAGKKTELKAALEAFGATKLSEVNEADYPALKQRLEAINAA